MELKNAGRKAMELIRKYRYPAIVLLLGLILMTFSGKKSDSVTLSTKPAIIQPDLTQSLTEILSQIKGVGKVQVMLTVSVGETTIYQYDEQISGSLETPSIRKETVIITDSSRNQSPLITQVLSPTYRGAVIVCQGAEDPQVKLAIVEAVGKATGLGADRISVLKMK